MTDWIPTRAEGENIMAAFTPRMGRRYANGRNYDAGPGAHEGACFVWSDRVAPPERTRSGSPFPWPTRLADGLGARKSPGPRLPAAVRPVRRVSLKSEGATE